MQIVLISPFDAERRALHELLHGDGHEIASVATRQEGLSLVLADHPEVIIIDAQLASCDYLATWSPGARVIVLCARATESCEGIVCLTKPIDLGELRRHIMVPQPMARLA